MNGIVTAEMERSQAIEQSLAVLLGKEEAKLALKVSAGEAVVDTSDAEEAKWM